MEQRSPIVERSSWETDSTDVLQMSSYVVQASAIARITGVSPCRLQNPLTGRPCVIEQRQRNNEKCIEG